MKVSDLTFATTALSQLEQEKADAESKPSNREPEKVIFTLKKFAIYTVFFHFSNHEYIYLYFRTQISKFLMGFWGFGVLGFWE